MSRHPEAVAQFVAQIRCTDSDACWNWTGAKNGDGYGQFWYLGHKKLAHRMAWRFRNPGEEIPLGLEIGHRCLNTSCVNPDHLEMVDGAMDREHQSVKTRCPRGHPYSGDNLYLRRDKHGREHRVCQACRRLLNLQ